MVLGQNVFPRWPVKPRSRSLARRLRRGVDSAGAGACSNALQYDPRYCPAVDIVIVAYGTHGRLRRCLESLQAHPPSRSHRVVVIDNGRDSETKAIVEGICPSVTCISPRENLGFTRAVNFGIRRSSSEYVLILNPDTEVYAETLDRLAAVLDERPEVAVAGPRLVRPDGSFDHAARRSFPTILGAIGHFLGVGRLMRRGPLAQYRAPQVKSGPVEAINGAFMLARRSALESIGLLDKGYWMYMEDLDLLYRLKKAGWLTWYEPGALALHVKRGTTDGVRSPRLVWAFHHGMRRFYRMHYATERSRPVNWLVYAGIGVRTAGLLAWSVAARPALSRRHQRKHGAVPPAQPGRAPSDAATASSPTT
jgi:hypothetical protein